MHRSLIGFVILALGLLLGRPWPRRSRLRKFPR